MTRHCVGSHKCAPQNSWAGQRREREESLKLMRPRLAIRLPLWRTQRRRTANRWPFRRTVSSTLEMKEIRGGGGGGGQGTRRVLGDAPDRLRMARRLDLLSTGLH